MPSSSVVAAWSPPLPPNAAAPAQRMGALPERLRKIGRSRKPNVSAPWAALKWPMVFTGTSQGGVASQPPDLHDAHPDSHTHLCTT
jgi:hypothetical protein